MVEVRKVTVWGPDKLDSGVYEVRWRVLLTAGHKDRRQQFPRKGRADAFIDQLRKAENGVEDRRSGGRWGWNDRYHPEIQLEEEPKVEPGGDTIWKVATDWRSATWNTQAPNGRKSASFALRSMVKWLVTGEDVLVPPDADAYLGAIAFRGPEEPTLNALKERYPRGTIEYLSGRKVALTTVDDVWKGRVWLEANSLPTELLTPTHLRRLLVKMCNGRKANTERRYWANVRTVLVWASKEKAADGSPRLGSDVWSAVAVRPAPITSLEEVGAVPDVSEMWVFAWACGAVGGDRSKGRWCALPLVMGGAGLRIGECMALLRRNITEITEGRGAGGMWIEVRRNRTTPGTDWTDAGDRAETRGTKRRGALGNLKGRTTFLPPKEAAVLRTHLELFVDRGPNAPVFTGPDGSRPDYGRLDRQVIKPAVKMAFPPPHRLSGVTPHGFRHLAATRWLRSGMALTTAARWGGWKQVSTMVDFYDSVLPNDDDAAADLMSY